jgi:hypothetical protein
VTGVLRWGLGALGAVGALALVRLLSFAPYTTHRESGALVRLAWRARGERVRDCRRLTSEELAKLPAHMRQEEVCEGRVLPYRLAVQLDDRAVVNQLIHGAGAREDRPLYVYQDLNVDAGAHRISIRFTLEGRPEAQGEDRLATPPQLALDTTLSLEPRQVLLVTYDEVREQLVVRDGSGR